MANDAAFASPDRRAVRDGQIAAVTCGACGCRLEAVTSPGGMTWFHFGRLGGRDARGDRVACIDAPHDAEGRPALAA
jgi:isoaspartyl peptidase/L-asparaginase-like protein (Ntn-hydrolase superfamily)